MAVVEPGTEILIAVTQKRVLVAERAKLRQDGLIRSTTRNDQIMFVRLTDNDPSARAELDFITTGANQKWRFYRGSATAGPVKEFADMLSTRIGAPEDARDAVASSGIKQDE